MAMRILVLDEMVTVDNVGNRGTADSEESASCCMI